MIRSAVIRLNRVLLSWNQFYAGIHHQARRRIAKEWHDLVRMEALVQLTPAERKVFQGPVAIYISCTFPPKARRFDVDNLVAKLVIDGLKGLLLKDDGPDHVYQVILGPCTRGKAASTLVRITEVYLDRQT